MGERADRRLVEADFVERTADAGLARRLPAGPVVAAIVGVVAVDDHRESARARQLAEDGVELVLAVVAAIDGIGTVLGPLHLVRLHDLVREAGLAREREGEIVVVRGIALAQSRHREGPIAVAVSTGGASPALAKRLRTQIAELVGPEHAELAEELRAMRPEVKERFSTYEERRDYFEEVVTERLS